MIVLRFVHCSDIISDGILVDTGGKYSHVEAVTPDGKYLGAHADGGVKARPKDYDAGKFDREIFYHLIADGVMTDAFYHYLDACIDEPYDFGAIAGFMLHYSEHERHRVICSALITLALRWCKFFMNELTVPAHEMSPRDVEMILSQRPDAATQPTCA